MSDPATVRRDPWPDVHRLLAYVADLELEVDRLRKEGAFLAAEFGTSLRRILALCSAASGGVAPEVAAAAQNMVAVLRALRESPGYHPAHDQVIAIAARPLIEQSFARQQTLTGNREVRLRLELETDHIEWFPARLRHILDNLLSNALRYRDPVKTDPCVTIGLRPTAGGSELRVSDNGLGGAAGAGRPASELLLRGAPVREAGAGVGLPVVRLLVEQSGGTVEVRSENGRGTDVIVTLPLYDVNDYLT